MKKINQNKWNDTKASGGEYDKLPAGAYICVIRSVEDVPDKEYLKIEYDNADGKYKNWWLDTQERAGFWGGTLYRSYKEKALGMFKGFTEAVEKTNDGFKWDWDEQALKGKYIGLILNYEQFLNKDNECKERIYVKSVVNARDIRAGKYNALKLTVKELKDEDKDKLADAEQTKEENDYEELQVGEIPF